MARARDLVDRKQQLIGDSPITPDENVSSPADLVRRRIAQTNDIQELIQIYRGFHNRVLGNEAGAVNALAGDKLAQMTGIDRNVISGMHDAEIVQAAQGRSEQRQMEDLAKKQQEDINRFADDFSGRAKTFRQQLAEALAKNNQQAFELQNPYILEDLNARGLFRSPTAVSQAQTEALKELEIGRQNSLLSFDTSAFDQEQDLRGGGLSHLIGGQQSALETALNARRTGLEMAHNQVLASQEQALAESLAKKKRRNDLYNSLISAGGNVASRALFPGA